MLRFSSLDKCRAFAGGRGNAWLDLVGLGLPVRPLSTMDLGAQQGLFGAAQRRDRPVFREMASRLVHDGWVATDLFGSTDGTDGTDLWPQVCAEGERLRTHMKPGKVMRPDGTTISGISPSGAKRGDVSVYLEADVRSRGLEAPALFHLNDCVSRVAQALADELAQLEMEPGVPFKLRGASDGKFARFPGDGSGYNAHTDGTKHGVVLTSILYTNPAWQPSHGGELHMLDDDKGGRQDWCWRSVAPTANRILWFRHKVLHKVCPAFKPRYALTHFWFEDRS